LALERSVRAWTKPAEGWLSASEAQIVRWVHFPAGALFFTLVPEEVRSQVQSMFFDRRQRGFYLWDFNDRMGRLQSCPNNEVLTDAPPTMLSAAPWLLETEV